MAPCSGDEPSEVHLICIHVTATRRAKVREKKKKEKKKSPANTRDKRVAIPIKIRRCNEDEAAVPHPRV